MSLRKAVYSLLSGIEGDVYPLKAPQETTAAYVVYSLRAAPVRTQEGVDVTDVDLTLQVYANTYSDCADLADTMYAGVEAAAGTYATETLHIANWISDDEFYLDDLDKYVITQEYQLRFL